MVEIQIDIYSNIKILYISRQFSALQNILDEIGIIIQVPVSIKEKSSVKTQMINFAVPI